MASKKQPIRFENLVREGFKCATMYAPVKTLTARQYAIRKKREARNQQPVKLRFS